MLFFLSLVSNTNNMKNIIISFFILFSTFLFAQNKERLSVHYFDLPSEKEAAFMKWTKKMNLILENKGFGKNFYKVYKVKSDDKAKTFRYFRISSYTSDKHYEMTHNLGDSYDKHLDAFWDSELGDFFSMDDKTHIYRKVYRVE